MKNRVLITSVGRKVSLVRAFKEAGWKVWGVDDDETAIALSICEPFKTMGEIDLLVPTRDAEISYVELGDYSGGRVLRPSYKTIDICLDKFQLSKWCKANGFMSPEIYFVKPRVSQSGKETECVWQELIEGDEYSVDLFADFDSNVISVVPRIRSLIKNGESCVTTTVEAPKLVESALELSRKLKLVGHNVLQAKWDGSSPIWLDINPRFGGASIVAIRAGCLSPEWLLKLVSGEKVKPCIGDYKVGLTGKSYTDWMFE